jgi:hypothetical protein
MPSTRLSAISDYPAIIFAMTILSAATAFPKPVVADKITVQPGPDKIVITGGRGKKITSDKFALSKDGWYILKISYTGAEISTCQLSLATQAMVTAKDTIGGLLTNWMGPSTTEKIKYRGSLKSDDYMIFVDEADGPWTVEILKSPKPEPVSGDLTFSGTTDKVTPFFHLRAGSATFTMNQKLKGRFSSRLEVNLVNADTGAYVTNLCHNSTEPTPRAKVDISEAGNYILEVIGGDTWEISYAQ